MITPTDQCNRYVGDWSYRKVTCAVPCTGSSDCEAGSKCDGGYCNRCRDDSKFCATKISMANDCDTISFVRSACPMMCGVCKADGFYLGKAGSECPVAKVVSTIEECRTAAAQFGLSYYSKNMPYYAYKQAPQGCLYSSALGGVFFNTPEEKPNDEISMKFNGICRKD